jgi:hypothetical protein
MASLSHGKDIFELSAERITLSSIRSIMAGYDLGDPACWDDLWATLVSEGGIDMACRLSGSLHFFVRTIRATQSHKLNYFPLSCKRACTDECLMLSLLSASQHNTSETLNFCLEQLQLEDEDQQELKTAAYRLSYELKSVGLSLLPVPLHVIKSIIPQICRECTITRGCIKTH